MDKETKSNLEKEIVTQLLDPIQSKYNELIKKKQDDERKALEELAKREENVGLPESPPANAESQTLPPPPSGDITDYETEQDEDEDEDEDENWTESGTDIGTDNGTDIGTEGRTESEMGTVDDQKEQDDIWRDVEEDEAAATIQQAWRKKKQAPETKEPETKEPEAEEKPEEKPEAQPEAKEELDKKIDFTTKSKPDASKAAFALQTLLKKEQDDLASQIEEKNNTKSLMSILPLLTKKQNLEKEITDEEKERKKIEKTVKKLEKQSETDINNIDSQIREKTNIESLLSILPLLAQKQELEKDIISEENKIKQLEKETKKEQQKLDTEIKSIDSQISEKTNVKSLLSILPLLAQKQKLEEAIKAETKEIEAHMKEQESRVKQLKKEIAVIEQNTKQHEILQKLLPILPLLTERQKLYDELNPKMTMAKMGEDLKNMFSNARGMIPSMPNMCDADVSGSASRALSGLSSYLSGVYQDLFEPYNEEFTVHRPPEQLGHLDKDQIAEYKYLGKFSMDMDIGDQPLKQVAHLYFNFKDNVFHTEMELDDILAVDKEMEKQLGFDPSKYPNGAVAIIGENPEILARAIDKDDPAYQQKLQQIKQTLQQGMVNPMMPMAVAQPVGVAEKGTIAI